MAIKKKRMLTHIAEGVCSQSQDFRFAILQDNISGEKRARVYSDDHAPHDMTLKEFNDLYQIEKLDD